VLPFLRCGDALASSWPEKAKGNTVPATSLDQRLLALGQGEDLDTVLGHQTGVLELGR